MKRRKLFGLLATIPFLGISKAQTDSKTVFSEQVEWCYIGLFDDKNLVMTLAVNLMFQNDPNVITRCCTRLMEGCIMNNYTVLKPNFQFSEKPFEIQ